VAGGAEDLEDAPPSTFVLRGGWLSSPSREKNLRDVREAYGLDGICAKALPGSPTAEDTAKGSNCGSKSLMVGVAGELVREGYRVVREPGRDWPNALILLPEDAEEPVWDHLREVFERRDAILNPTYKGK
jgi:hypothetical protein